MSRGARVVQKAPADTALGLSGRPTALRRLYESRLRVFGAVRLLDPELIELHAPYGVLLVVAHAFGNECQG